MSVAFTDPATFTPGNKPVDINNDGAVDYNVNVVTPTCLSIVPIKRDSGELNPLIARDAPCFGSAVAGAAGVVVAGVGGAGVGGGDSQCSNTQWALSASAVDPISGASVSIHQGTAVRVAVGTAC